MSESLVKPFIKWVGGKRQILDIINKKINEAGKYNTYYEPFLGGGAVFLDNRPDKAVVNDYNSELINAYKIIRDNVDELIESLEKHKNEQEYYYKIRAKDRDEGFKGISKIEKASRFIYLNKTCYNGLYRVNRENQFNTPFGKYKNPNIVNEEVLRALNKYFNTANITFLNEDFEKALKSVSSDDFVYLDPPYVPVSETSSFTSYTKNGFELKDQERLADVCKTINAKGAKFLLSNSNVPIMYELYNEFHIDVVAAKRSINSKGDKRGKVEEVIIYNF